jgi:hypothetical protein
VAELKARRDRLAEVEAATQARAEALMVTEAEGDRLDRVTTDLIAFAATLRAGLAELDFAGRERLVRLLIERVVVTDDQVAIEHVIPLSRRFAGLRPRDRGPGRDPPDSDAPGVVDRPGGAGAGSGPTPGR